MRWKPAVCAACLLLGLGLSCGVVAYIILKARAREPAERAAAPPPTIRLTPANVPDPFGHVWTLPEGSTRYAFAEAHAAYLATELSARVRGPNFFGAALGLGECARAGEVLTYQDLVRYFGPPDRQSVSTAGGAVVVYESIQGPEPRQTWMLYMSMSPSGTLTQVGFNRAGTDK